MNPPLFFLILAVSLLVWTALPFIPAILELRRPTDFLALDVPEYYKADTRFFARSFRDHVRAELTDSPSEPGDGRFPEGALISFLTGEGAAISFLTGEGRSVMSTGTDPAEPGAAMALFAATRVTVPDGATLMGDVFAPRGIDGGEDVTYRALYADRDILLGQGSTVLRWVHADGAMLVGANTLLAGRASSEIRLELAEGVQFERLYSPEICFGASENAADPEFESEPLTLQLDDQHSRGVATFKGDLELPERSLVLSDIVCRGSLVIGRGSVIRGSIKAHFGMELRDGVRVEGAAVSVRTLNIGKNCFLRGPVISEREAYLAEGAEIGTAACGTSFVARTIYAAPGSVAHGTVWARTLGFVTPLVE